MLGFIKGKILSITPECALIETASGIGFEVTCSASAFSSLAGKKEGEVYTYLSVSENGAALFCRCKCLLPLRRKIPHFWKVAVARRL